MYVLDFKENDMFIPSETRTLIACSRQAEGVGHLLVSLFGRRADLAHHRVLGAARPPAHHVLPHSGRVVQPVLHHEVHRRPHVQVLAQVTEVVQYIRVL